MLPCFVSRVPPLALGNLGRRTSSGARTAHLPYGPALPPQLSPAPMTAPGAARLGAPEVGAAAAAGDATTAPAISGVGALARQNAQLLLCLLTMGDYKFILGRSNTVFP